MASSTGFNPSSTNTPFYIPPNSSAKIKGIHFYNTSSECINGYNKLPWTKKATSFLHGFRSYFTHQFEKLSLYFDRNKQASQSPYTNNQNLVKRKLVVGLHGLGSSPRQFTKIINRMQKEDLSETDIYTPSVLNRGYGPLDNMVAPIFADIKKWANTGGEELVLIGISNGSLIAHAIENEVANSTECKNIRKIKFISVVGAWKGSTFADFGLKCGAGPFLPKYIREEMPTNSKRMQQLNADWLRGQNNVDIKRDYTFLASPHDLTVPNYSSTLPHIDGHPTRYGMLKKCGHNYAPSPAAKAVAKIACSG